MDREGTVRAITCRWCVGQGRHSSVCNVPVVCWTGKARLGLDETAKVRVVLEDDGTAVDDEEYFSTLDPHTVLMIIPPGHRWTDSKTFE